MFTYAVDKFSCLLKEGRTKTFLIKKVTTDYESNASFDVKKKKTYQLRMH